MEMNESKHQAFEILVVKEPVWTFETRENRPMTHAMILQAGHLGNPLADGTPRVSYGSALWEPYGNWGSHRWRYKITPV